MSQKKRQGIMLWVGAVILFAASAAAMMLDHWKTGYGLAGLGVIVVIAGLVTFFSRSSPKVELPGKDWI